MAKRKTPAPNAAPELQRSLTGTPLDPEDGKPVFAQIDGVWFSRVRWLEATKEDRRKAVVDELREFAASGDAEAATPE